MNDQEIRLRMDKPVAFLEENLRRLRIGRANASLLESVKVDAYGALMPLNQVATVSVVDFKTMVIQPWDKNNLDGIEKAINAANLGMTPVKDGEIVRISVPELTEERRKELVKVVGTYEEEAKIALRQVRKEVIESIKNNKESTEDDVKGITEKADKIIKEYNQKVGELCEAKRQEMLTV